MIKLLFLANLQYGEEPTGGGVQTRNQFMLDWLVKRFDVKFYDTWKKRAIISLIFCFILIVLNKNRFVFISFGSRGALALMKVLCLFHCRRRILFFVPGNDYADLKNPQNARYWNCFEGILVQSKFMVDELNKCGFTNITYCPNFKYIYYRPSPQKEHGNILRFVYVGRLIKEKGIQVMIDACKQLSEIFQLSIYGKETCNYNKEFFEQLNDHRIEYKGYLNLKTKEGLDELASHDVLLFPTFFEGEGFSGTLIDAFVCGLPVIATNYNVNSEIVEDGVNGLIIPPNDISALSQAMENIISGSIKINKMSESSYKSASNYNIDTVMGRICDGLSC